MAKKKVVLQKPLNVYIGARVRALRIKTKMSTTALGKKMSVSQAQVSRLETGQQGWRMEQLVKAAVILKVPVSILTAPKNARLVTVTYTNKTSKSWEV